MNVIDAGVVVSALRSRNGASHLVLRGMLTGDVPFAASSAVVLEYEAVVKRPGIRGDAPWMGTEEIDVVLDAICARAIISLPWFRFRPFLNDPKDDLYANARWRRALRRSSRMIATSTIRASRRSG
jgi:predicted nucleic acid-binding protein